MTVARIALPAPPAAAPPQPTTLAAHKPRQEGPPSEASFSKILRRKDEESRQVEKDGALAAGQTAAAVPAQAEPAKSPSGVEGQAAPTVDQSPGQSGSAKAVSPEGSANGQAAPSPAPAGESNVASASAPNATPDLAQAAKGMASMQAQGSPAAGTSPTGEDQPAANLKPTALPQTLSPGDSAKEANPSQTAGQPAQNTAAAVQVRQAPGQDPVPVPVQANSGTTGKASLPGGEKTGGEQASDAQTGQSASPTARPGWPAVGGAQGSPPGIDLLPTSEPARLAEAHTAGLLRQVGDQLQALVKTGSNTFRMQLYPEELGHIELRLTTGHSGMGVTLIADQSSTGRLLEAQLDALRHSLAQAGVQLNSLNVGHESLLRQNPGQQQAQANPWQGSSPAPPKPEPGHELGPKRFSPVPTSGIDYRI